MLTLGLNLEVVGSIFNRLSLGSNLEVTISVLSGCLNFYLEFDFI